jgi:hypothetical protein
MRCVMNNATRSWLSIAWLALSACHDRPAVSPSVPSVPDLTPVAATVLTRPTGTDCPSRLRSFRNCLNATEGYNLTLESISPAPPARLAFGQSVIARVRYVSRFEGLRIQVQPSSRDGCAGYDWQIDGRVERVPAGTGTVERTFTLRSAAVRGCGPSKIRVEHGDVYVERLRLLLGPTEPAFPVFYEEYLMSWFGQPVFVFAADARFVRP